MRSGCPPFPGTRRKGGRRYSGNGAGTRARRSSPPRLSGPARRSRRGIGRELSLERPHVPQKTRIPRREIATYLPFRFERSPLPKYTVFVVFSEGNARHVAK